MTVRFACSPAEYSEAHLEPCLCAQLCGAFTRAFREPKLLSDRAVLLELQGAADRECSFCRGGGTEFVPGSDPAAFDIANVNARPFLAMLGIRAQSLIGEFSLPEAKRAIIRARARRSLEEFLRPREVIKGSPAYRGDGTLELAPLRAIVSELTEERLLYHLGLFERLVETAAARAAKSGEAAVICWG